MGILQGKQCFTPGNLRTSTEKIRVPKQVNLHHMKHQLERRVPENNNRTLLGNHRVVVPQESISKFLEFAALKNNEQRDCSCQDRSPFQKHVY